MLTLIHYQMNHQPDAFISNDIEIETNNLIWIRHQNILVCYVYEKVIKSDSNTVTVSKYMIDVGHLLRII